MRNWTIVVIVASIGLGCSNEHGTKSAPPKPAADSASVRDNAHPAHGSRGPHGGDVIELGNDEYHAELVHDDQTNDVTIFILDGAAKNAVAIEATEVVIHLKHEGDPVQYKLAAKPQDTDSPGKSSRFVSEKNEELGHALVEVGAAPRLHVTIGGKAYSGKFEHDHKHPKHEHEEKK